jgi:hypothetical protein
MKYYIRFHIYETKNVEMGRTCSRDGSVEEYI